MLNVAGICSLTDLERRVKQDIVIFNHRQKDQHQSDERENFA